MRSRRFFGNTRDFSPANNNKKHQLTSKNIRMNESVDVKIMLLRQVYINDSSLLEVASDASLEGFAAAAPSAAAASTT